MVTTPEIEVLISAVQEAVEQGLEHFEGPGATSQVRVDQWGVRDVLSHFAFWHAGTAQGMESVAGGGKPFQVDAPVDEANAREISSRAGYNFPQLVREIRELQERLAKAARNLADPDSTVVVLLNGTGLSARKRLEIIARHWRGHIEELQTTAGS